MCPKYHQVHIESKRNELVKIRRHYEEALNKSIAKIKSGITVSNTEVEESIEKWIYK